MFVSSGLEPHVAPRLAMIARDRIGRDRLIGVADMRASVRIADRGGDIIRFAHAGPVSAVLSRLEPPAGALRLSSFAWLPQRAARRKARRTCRHRRGTPRDR